MAAPAQKTSLDGSGADPVLSLQPPHAASHESTVLKIRHQVGGHGLVAAKELRTSHPSLPAPRFQILDIRPLTREQYNDFAQRAQSPVKPAPGSITDEEIVDQVSGSQPLLPRGVPKDASITTAIRVHHKVGSDGLVLTRQLLAFHAGLPAPRFTIQGQRDLMRSEYEALLQQARGKPASDPLKDLFEQNPLLARTLGKQPSDHKSESEQLMERTRALPPPAPLEKEFDFTLPPEDGEAVFDFACWARESGIWDGRPVSLEGAAQFQERLEERILQLLGSQDPMSAEFQKLASRLAWAGAGLEDQFTLAADIQALQISRDGTVIQVGLWRDLGKAASRIGRFVKDHKKEILIGAAVIAVVTTVVVVAVCTGGTAASAAAAGGGALLDGLNQPDSKPSEPNPAPPPEPAFPVAPIPVQEIPAAPSPPGQTVFEENGVLLGGEFFSYRDILQRIHLEEMLQANAAGFPQPAPLPPPAVSPQPACQTYPEKSWFATFLEQVGSDELAASEPQPPQKRFPIAFATPGSREAGVRIGGINGMDTSFDGAQSHAAYIASFAQGKSVDWVYNHTNGKATDLAEILSMNYLGVSPNTSRELQKNWTQFHEANKDNPHAKYLHFCHSQGAIHTRNALARLPEEIRDRVIVVAIAPGAIVPDEICYKSFNYASKRDPVPFGGLIPAGFTDTNEYRTSVVLEKTLKDLKELIVLDPHPDAPLIDHDFQSPTFVKTIQDHIADYEKNKGEYK